MNDYIEISISIEGEDQKDLLVARLADIGFEGFEEDIKLLRAYIPQDNFDPALVSSIVESHAVEYSSRVIKQRNWNELWEAGFEPVVIADFCAIRAAFHAPVDGVRHEIIITPKMSFGTGHHATTYLMVEAMSHIDFTSKTVLDFGTGTGILAILAEKLGATSIVALDSDDWSIENGKENLERNNCKNINLYKSDSLAGIDKADILLANINKNVIVQHFISMKEHLLPGGYLLISGLLAGDLGDLEKLAHTEKLMITEVKARNSWICLLIINK